MERQQGFEDGGGERDPQVADNAQEHSDESGSQSGKREGSKLRRACDYCTKKKVRCDGMHPCGQCQRRSIVCNFSICQRSGPRSYPPGSGGVGMQGGGGMAGMMMHQSMDGPPQQHHQQQPHQQQPVDDRQQSQQPNNFAAMPDESHASNAAVLARGGITSNSDVTCLNMFLKEFNAFLPLATRTILVEAINPPHAQLAPDGTLLIHNITEPDFRRQNARVVVIQGCVAIGALLRGEPVIDNHLRTVRSALMQCFDFVCIETMSAYMVIAVCHDLLGNGAATRNYMELAKAIEAQLPMSPIDNQLVFQFARVCFEIHGRTLSKPPRLIPNPLPGPPAPPAYQVLTVLTYILYDLTHLSIGEDAGTITRSQVEAELAALLVLLEHANNIYVQHKNSFGSLGAVLIKLTLAYVLLRMNRNSDGLKVLEPVVGMLEAIPGLMRQIVVWHLSHCVMVIYLENGCFGEYDAVCKVYNRVLTTNVGAHFKDARPFPAVDQLHQFGSNFLCPNPLCKAVYADLSWGAQGGRAAATPASTQQPGPHQHQSAGAVATGSIPPTSTDTAQPKAPTPPADTPAIAASASAGSSEKITPVSIVPTPASVVPAALRPPDTKHILLADNPLEIARLRNMVPGDDYIALEPRQETRNTPTNGQMNAAPPARQQQQQHHALAEALSSAGGSRKRPFHHEYMTEQLQRHSEQQLPPPLHSSMSSYLGGHNRLPQRGPTPPSSYGAGMMSGMMQQSIAGPREATRSPFDERRGQAPLPLSPQQMRQLPGFQSGGGIWTGPQPMHPQVQQYRDGQPRGRQQEERDSALSSDPANEV